MIDSFSGHYWFLSNFSDSIVTYEGLTYPTIEHAYQAAKVLDPEQRAMIQSAETPANAKRLGRGVTLRADWEEQKVEIMTFLVRQKFFNNPQLAEALLATKDEELVEGNTWGDRFWGMVFNYRRKEWEGRNQLGKILMQVRQELKTRGKP
jgi:N-glycosidase YbiA